MVQERINRIHDALANNEDIDVLSLARELETVLEHSDGPKLVEVIQRSDASVFSKELFGSMLCALDRPDLLEPLIIAMDEVFAEGHDGDGFQATLTDLVETHPVESLEVLRDMERRVTAPVSSETVNWLLEYCTSELE